MWVGRCKCHARSPLYSPSHICTHTPKLPFDTKENPEVDALRNAFTTRILLSNLGGALILYIYRNVIVNTVVNM